MTFGIEGDFTCQYVSLVACEGDFIAGIEDDLLRLEGPIAWRPREATFTTWVKRKVVFIISLTTLNNLIFFFISVAYAADITGRTYIG